MMGRGGMTLEGKVNSADINSVASCLPRWKCRTSRMVNREWWMVGCGGQGSKRPVWVSPALTKLSLSCHVFHAIPVA